MKGTVFAPKLSVFLSDCDDQCVASFCQTVCYPMSLNYHSFIFEEGRVSFSVVLVLISRSDKIYFACVKGVFLKNNETW